MAYEYTYIEPNATMAKDALITELNTMGADGWQFQSLHVEGGIYRIWFMREL
jgi:hypothetical protein